MAHSLGKEKLIKKKMWKKRKDFRANLMQYFMKDEREVDFSSTYLGWKVNNADSATVIIHLFLYVLDTLHAKLFSITSPSRGRENRFLTEYTHTLSTKGGWTISVTHYRISWGVSEFPHTAQPGGNPLGIREKFFITTLIAFPRTPVYASCDFRPHPQ